MVEPSVPMYWNPSVLMIENDVFDADWLAQLYAVNVWPVSPLVTVFGLHLAAAMTLLMKSPPSRQMPLAVNRMLCNTCCSYETLNSSVRGWCMSFEIAYTCAGMITCTGPIGWPAALTS